MVKTGSTLRKPLQASGLTPETTIVNSATQTHLSGRVVVATVRSFVRHGWFWCWCLDCNTTWLCRTGICGNWGYRLSTLVIAIKVQLTPPQQMQMNRTNAAAFWFTWLHQKIQKGGNKRKWNWTRPVNDKKKNIFCIWHTPRKMFSDTLCDVMQYNCQL